MRHLWDATERIPSFAYMPPHVRILSEIVRIWRGREALRDDVISKFIEELDKRGVLDGFNQNQMGEIFQGF